MPQISIVNHDTSLSLFIMEGETLNAGVTLDATAAIRIALDLLAKAHVADRAAARAGTDRLQAECEKLARLIKVIFERVDTDGLLTERIRRDFPDLLPPSEPAAPSRKPSRKSAAKKPAHRKGKR